MVCFCGRHVCQDCEFEPYDPPQHIMYPEKPRETEFKEPCRHCWEWFHDSYKCEFKPKSPEIAELYKFKYFTWGE